MTFEDLKQSLGDCRMCGGPLDWDWGAEENRLLAEMHARGGPVLGLLRGLQPVCTPCSREEERRRRRAERHERIREHVAEAYALGCLPEEARACTLARSNPEAEAHSPTAWGWARNWGMRSPNAWLMGPEGVGKTYLARCVLNAALERGLSAAEVSAFELNRRAERFGLEALLKRWCGVDVLLLEDLDKARWDEDGIEYLWYILDRRSAAQRRLIITANVAPEHMKRVWDGAAWQNESKVQTLWERMIPIGRYEFEGRSFRRDLQRAVVAQGVKG